MRRVKQTKKKSVFNGPLVSMLISLILVAAAVGVVFGFGAYLKEQTYEGPEIMSGLETTEKKQEDQEYLDIDEGFRPCYIMIGEVPAFGLWANSVPGIKDKDSQLLVSGQILRAQKRGNYEGQTYYKLKNGLYVSANITHAEPLISYTKLEGYIAITYLSSSGVNLRKWADFDADNIVGSVYVGDKVQVKAKVETEKGASAYLTEDGLYITADSRYSNDYTSVPEEEKKGEAKTTESERWDFSDPVLNGNGRS